MRRTLICFSLAAAAFVGCSDDDTPADTGMTDTGTADTGMTDTGMTDTSMEDASMEDTAMTDTGMTDTSMEDATADTTPDATGPEARGADNPPTLGTQIDRIGRPAITSALVGTFLPSEDADPLKDAYNAAADQGDWTVYASDIAFSLGVLDALDTNCGNQLLAGSGADGPYDALAAVLVDDQLYVHSERTTCGVYLGLEAELVGAVEDGVGGCGGRMLDDDVIDRSYSVLAAGILTGIDDTITANDVPNMDTFPFVAAPAGE